MLYYPYFANDLVFLLNFGVYFGERTFFFVFHFFSSFYCVDFFISFVLRHLLVKQFFTLRMSRILRIVQEKNAFHQSRTGRKDDRAAPEMSARHNSGANKN